MYFVVPAHFPIRMRNCSKRVKSTRVSWSRFVFVVVIEETWPESFQPIPNRKPLKIFRLCNVLAYPRFRSWSCILAISTLYICFVADKWSFIHCIFEMLNLGCVFVGKSKKRICDLRSTDSSVSKKRKIRKKDYLL